MVAELRSNFCSICGKAGNRKPRVLPLPVFAMEMRSVPVSANGQDTDCVGVGFAKPSLASFCLHAALKGFWRTRRRAPVPSRSARRRAPSRRRRRSIPTLRRAPAPVVPLAFEKESLRGFGCQELLFLQRFAGRALLGRFVLRFLDFFFCLRQRPWCVAAFVAQGQMHGLLARRYLLE